MAFNPKYIGTTQMILIFDEVRVVTFDIGEQVVLSFDVRVEAVPVPVKAPVATPQRSGLSPKKRNKIINSTYKSGENLKGNDYHFESEIKVEAGYASTHLGHIYDVDNNMVSRKVQEEIMLLIGMNEELRDMLDEENPKKFNREKVNRMFKLIYEHFERKPDARTFSNLVQIFDNVANLSKLKYASLYDLLDGEYKQMLLVELDKTYDILKLSGKTNRLF